MLSYGRAACCTAAAVGVMLASPALAGAPDMLLKVTANGSLYETWLPPTSVTEGGAVGTYSGNAAQAGSWSAYYNFTGSSTAAAASQFGTLSITNSSNATADFIVTLGLPTYAVQAMTGLFNGSVAGTLITNGSGSLQSLTSTPIWSATTQDLTVASLFTAPLTVNRSTSGATNFGSQSFGATSTPLFGDVVAVTFAFRLTAGDTASFNSGLSGTGSPVPAPAVLPILGIGSTLLRRRRR